MQHCVVVHDSWAWLLTMTNRAAAGSVAGCQGILARIWAILPRQCQPLPAGGAITYHSYHHTLVLQHGALCSGGECGIFLHGSRREAVNMVLAGEVSLTLTGICRRYWGFPGGWGGFVILCFNPTRIVPYLETNLWRCLPDPCGNPIALMNHVRTVTPDPARFLT